MKILMFLFILSFYCLGLEVPKVPKLIKGVIIHHSNSESDFQVDVRDIGDCTTGEYATTCTNGDITAAIGKKSFAMDQVKIFKDKGAVPAFPLIYYFYGDLPFSKGELTTPVRLAVLINQHGEVGNIHLKFTNFNSKEDVLFKKIEY